MLLLLLLFCCSSLVAHTIEWDAVAYFNNSAPQQQLALSYLQKIKESSPRAILDIGCGDGKITAFIAQQYPSATVVGIDNSPSMILFAQQHFGHIPNLSFECIDAAKIRYTNRFDLIVSFFCLHWVEDQDMALRALSRAAVPGANILLLFSIEPDQPILRSMRYANSVEPFAHYFSKYVVPVEPLDPVNTIKVLAEEGCTVHSYSVDAKADIFENKQAFYNYLHAMPLADALGAALFDEYIKIVVHHYFTLCPVPENGQVLYQSPVGVLQLKKRV